MYTTAVDSGRVVCPVACPIGGSSLDTPYSLVVASCTVLVVLVDAVVDGKAVDVASGVVLVDAVVDGKAVVVVSGVVLEGTVNKMAVDGKASQNRKIG